MKDDKSHEWVVRGNVVVYIFTVVMVHLLLVGLNQYSMVDGCTNIAISISTILLIASLEYMNIKLTKITVIGMYMVMCIAIDGLMDVTKGILI